MQIHVATVEEYVAQVPAERQVAFGKLRTAILANMPDGFEEVMSYGMLGYVVPKTIYPKGYHCTPALPLPFAGLASQKNFIAFYHMGIYAQKELLDWFVDSYTKTSKYKLDMGKSCIRFKKMDDIPHELIGELMKKISVHQWIETYEFLYKK